MGDLRYGYPLAVEEAHQGMAAYGDYTVRDCGAPSEFGGASANVRYTSETVWVVQRGNKVSSGGSGEMKWMSESLTKQPEWRGEAFSAGSEEFAATAARTSNFGGGQQWVQWAVNHHIETVVEQLRGLDA